MDDLLSEKEQIEQIRTWWSEYGGYVIGGLGLGIAILAGYSYYDNSKVEAQRGGSSAYETLIGHVVSGELDAAETVADSIETEYANTAYAAQARLAMARLFMEKNRDEDAADVLRELIDSDAETAIKHVARTRLARILLYQDNADAVVDLLEGQDSEAFAATWNELLGDAYRQLGQFAAAEAAYQRALLDPMAQATVDQQFVQWKVLDLPEQQTSAGESMPTATPATEPALDDEAAEPASEDGE